jgi:hypothetical protein
MRDKTLDFDLTPESAPTPDSVADELDALRLTINMQGLEIDNEARAQYPQEEQDWDKVKDVIMRLYQDEGMTLAELQRHLLKHHNFKATYAL